MRGSFFRLVVTRRQTSYDPPLESAEVLLRAIVDRAADGALERFLPESGRVLDDRRREVLARRLRVDREYSDAEIARRLRDEGARFGPDNRERLVATVALKLVALAKVLGPIVVEETAFVGWFGDTAPEDREPLLVSNVYHLFTRGHLALGLHSDVMGWTGPNGYSHYELWALNLTPFPLPVRVCVEGTDAGPQAHHGQVAVTRSGDWRGFLSGWSGP